VKQLPRKIKFAITNIWDYVRLYNVTARLIFKEMDKFPNEKVALRVTYRIGATKNFTTKDKDIKPNLERGEMKTKTEEKNLNAFSKEHGEGPVKVFNVKRGAGKGYLIVVEGPNSYHTSKPSLYEAVGTIRKHILWRERERGLK